MNTAQHATPNRMTTGHLAKIAGRSESAGRSTPGLKSDHAQRLTLINADAHVAA